MKKYIKYCQEEDKATQRPYTSRYIGSLVADFHRNLLKGGIYLYPSTASHPDGKLRLLYECNPMAFLAEQAGGKASDGKERILDIVPESLHQRRSFFVGNNHMVEDVENFIKSFPDAKRLPAPPAPAGGASRLATPRPAHPRHRRILPVFPQHGQPTLQRDKDKQQNADGDFRPP